MIAVMPLPLHCFKTVASKIPKLMTTEGQPLLGAPLGNVDYCTSFLQSKLSSLVQEVRTLARIARTEPHAAYSAFTHGLAGKWNYLMRVSPTFREFLEPLESTIRTEYLASLIGRCISNLERSLRGRLCDLPPMSGHGLDGHALRGA